MLRSLVVFLLLVGVVQAAPRKKPAPKSASKEIALPLKVGAAGTLPYAQCVQVIDGDNAILSLSFLTEQWVARGNRPVKVAKPIEETVWAKIPTAGMVSDKYYVFTKQGPEIADSGKEYGPQTKFKITGTKTYETAVGSKTVFVVEPQSSR